MSTFGSWLLVGAAGAGAVSVSWWLQGPLPGIWGGITFQHRHTAERILAAAP